jgi:hypothetical protein
MARSVRVSLAGALLVWLMGFIFALADVSFNLIKMIAASKELGPVVGVMSDIVLLFILIAAAVHQLLIYYSIHEMDTPSAEYVAEFGEWLGSTREMWLRFATLVVLLCVGGEIPLLVEHLVRRSSVDQAPRRLLWTFPISSAVLCLVLLAWDLEAWKHKKKAETTLKWLRMNWSLWTTREWFLISDLSCAVIWILICLAYFSESRFVWQNYRVGFSLAIVVVILLLLAIVYVTLIVRRSMTALPKMWRSLVEAGLA